jgi:hypothetical protein
MGRIGRLTDDHLSVAPPSGSCLAAVAARSIFASALEVSLRTARGASWNREGVQRHIARSGAVLRVGVRQIGPIGQFEVCKVERRGRSASSEGVPVFVGDRGPEPRSGEG